jgi:hypothetical protein
LIFCIKNSAWLPSLSISSAGAAVSELPSSVLTLLSFQKIKFRTCKLNRHSSSS